ncbi:MAG: hypothetical protein E7600_04650 [Ruminococcaceae bacterium]|nr:hypothetical protein [Oscillospiraceae bacterium]
MKKIFFCLILALSLSLTAFCAEEIIFDFGKESDGLFGYSAYEIENISYDGTALVYTNKTPGNSGLRGTPLSSLDINGTDYSKIEVRYKVENTVTTNGTSSLFYFQQLDRETDAQKVGLWSSVFSASVPYSASPEYVTQVWNLSQFPALADNKLGESFFGIGLNSGSAGVKCYIDYIKFIPAAEPGKGITKDENGIVTLDFGLEADEFFGMYGVSISDVTYDGEAVIYTNTTDRNSGFRGDVLSKYDINGTDYAEIEVRFKVTGIPTSGNSSCMLYCAQLNRETNAVEVSLWSQSLNQLFSASSAGEYMTVKFSLSTYSGIENRKIGEIFFGTGFATGASNVKCYVDYIKFIPHNAVEADPVPDPEVVVKEGKYSVTYVANNKSGKVSDMPKRRTVYVDKNSSMPIPEKNPARDGFTFKGWSTTVSAADIVSSTDTVTKNTTLYAIWEGTETPSEEAVQLVYPGFAKKAIIFSTDEDDGNQRSDVGLTQRFRNHGFNAAFNLVARPYENANETKIASLKELYDGFEIANHSYSHIGMMQSNTSTTDALCIEDCKKGKEILEGIFGEGSIHGMIWPVSHGDREAVVNHVMENYEYVRSAPAEAGGDYFAVPTSFGPNWRWTCVDWHNDVTYLTKYADEYFALESDELTLFSLWSHSVFYPVNDNWYVMDDFLNDFTHSGQNIWNPQPHKYVEYVKAMQQVTVEDGIVTNTSDIDIYAIVDGNEVVIPAGESYGSTVEIDLGERASSGNVRYCEIGGEQKPVVENNNKLYVVAADENLVVEVVEKTEDGDVVKTNYYYVDAASLTYEKLSLESYTNSDYESSVRVSEKSGIRFKADVLTSVKNQETEYTIEEYGFIITREDLLGDNQLNFDFSTYVYGVAYNKNIALDIVFDSTDDELCVFAGVLYNIPEKHYDTNLVCKTYTKISVGGEEFTVYGEQVTANLFEIASALLETELDEKVREYMLSVVDAVIPDIMVDVGDLYN